MTTRAKVDSAKTVAAEACAPVQDLSDRQMQDIARAVSDPRRFDILQQIASNSSSACSALRAACPITAATLSHHLKELERAGLIAATKRGKFVDLRFRRDVWAAYLARLNQL